MTMTESKKKSLAHFEYAFCDSLSALEEAHKQGLSPNCRILTRSPALISEKPQVAVKLDARIGASTKQLADFYLSTSKFLQTCADLLNRNEITGKFSAISARELWHAQQRDLFSIFLTDEDYSHPRLMIQADYKDPQKNAIFNTRWDNFFQGHTNFYKHVVTANHEYQFPMIAEPTPFLSKLRVKGLGHFGWRALQELWKYLPEQFGDSRFLFLRESEIVRDVGLHHALRGWRPMKLALPKPPNADYELHPTAVEVKNILGLALLDRWQKVSIEHACKTILKRYISALSTTFYHYDFYSKWLNENEENIFGNKKNIIVSNYPIGPDALAVANFAKKKRIFFAGVQHGVARELLADPQNLCNYENTFSEGAITLNSVSKTMLDNNPFKAPHSQTMSYGLPADFGRIFSSSKNDYPQKLEPRILFIQMLNRTGCFFNGGIYKNDEECIRQETHLITDVFEKINTPVDFKYYPHQSYADSDPVLRLVENCKNTNLLKTGQDLRFLIHEADVLITMAISSTLSWCVFSDKPTIYLDPAIVGYRASQASLPHIKEALFYFDMRDDDYLNQLRQFLNQDQRHILKLWNKRSQSRNDFRSLFFGKTKEKRTELAYQWLHKNKS